MRLGAYLVEENLVERMDIIRALEEQRKNQSPLGRIALEQEILSVNQVCEILDAQADRIGGEATCESGSLFGEIAVEFGYLSESDCSWLLGEQRATRRCIGAILVEFEVIDQGQLDHALAELQMEMPVIA